MVADIFNLDRTHVLVTGASSGLGRHFALRLSEAGARVTLAARREQALANSVEAIRAGNRQASAVVMDVTDAASIESALDKAEHAFGPVGVLINNAGVTETRLALEIDENGWDHVVG
ncbi:MAG: SDR family NAD(P)-dependent oxidoreductase, partial [Acetobacteraceae bacterium]|nr:SDR family NAD(P)-dependent oxidoreductase [Acetobacteraceae bacterium]